MNDSILKTEQSQPELQVAVVAKPKEDDHGHSDSLNHGNAEHRRLHAVKIEDKFDNSDSGGEGFNNDEDPDYDLKIDKTTETCYVYEEDETGAKIKNLLKTYTMSPVENFLGIRINDKDVYYDEKACNAYNKRAKKLMKYQQHIEEVVYS